MPNRGIIVTRKGRSLLLRYLDLRRAKTLGSWRFSLPACMGIFLLLTPSVLLIDAMVGLAVIYVVMGETDLLRVPLTAGVVAAVVMLVVAVALAEVIYLALRQSPPARDSRHCHTCGYDLRGSIEAARCPECGAPFDPAELPGSMLEGPPAGGQGGSNEPAK